MNASSTVPTRSMTLKTFDPHRKEFTCAHEADHVPPIDPEAEVWFQEGMRVTSMDLWPNQRDYPRAVALWTKAAERKHWKGMINLASVLLEGDGTEPYVVPPDTERAVQIIEEAMRLGIPAAFDAMGSYAQHNFIKGGSSRAYAFWELAADMGSPSAQTFLGKSLAAAYDNPKEGFWGNRRIGLQMLECAYAQGYGPAAFQLGLTLGNTDKEYARALRILHEGVKMGSEDSAGYLASTFRDVDPMTGGTLVDTARSERYSILGDALYRNHDLRFPNLDKVLPLPPARLPKWDGNKKTLIDAAKAVLPAPPKPAAQSTPHAAAALPVRAQIPDGWMLPEHPVTGVPAQYETTAAPVSGYWLARLVRPSTDQHHSWNAAQLPLRYKAGEFFDRSRSGLKPEDGRIQFHYIGEAVEKPVVATQNPRVARRIAREAVLPEPLLQCAGHQPCPQTGVWAASVPDEHPLARVFNEWHRQSYVIAGQAFPDPHALHLDIAHDDVKWIWWNQANEQRTPELTYIRVGDPVIAVGDNSADTPPASDA